jgi:hypothetical protein
MNKAPNPGGMIPYRKAMPSLSGRSSYSKGAGQTSSSAAPSASSATSGYQSSNHAQPTQGYEPGASIHSYDPYETAEDEDEEHLSMNGEHRIVIAIDYGTTFIGMLKLLQAVTQQTILSTAS